ncbi:hypothetical protein [Rhizobium leguminosarum]|uniref:hypothetical protein n=1 Tax=Rhizobium leguminosarum TaxID=384 RepID=UPI0014414609|nr:hypothetical protein [Rhizobium leguminosarum]MBY5868470.1 hypothetical protein [Rhizobium leguminosarum]
MNHLPFPEATGDQIIIAQCKKAGWAVTEARWLAAAALYRRFNGNPWKVSPASFTKSEKKKLYALYDSRSQGGPISRLRRPNTPFKSCPMCGSLGGRSVDHALPRIFFPEFSVMRENLVPACDMCNSTQKGDTYRGSRPERFIHPYYDRWASQPLWRVAFQPDLDVLQFEPVALPTLPRRKRIIVSFHVRNLLGADWRDSVRRAWTPMPSILHRRLGACPTEQAVRAELEHQLKDSADFYGVNSWHAGFLRGVLADPLVVAKLTDLVRTLPV